MAHNYSRQTNLLTFAVCAATASLTKTLTCTFACNSCCYAAKQAHICFFGSMTDLYSDGCILRKLTFLFCTIYIIFIHIWLWLPGKCNNAYILFSSNFRVSTCAWLKWRDLWCLLLLPLLWRSFRTVFPENASVVCICLRS